MSQLRRRGRPEAERAVHVHPATVPVRDVDRIHHRIKGPRVHVAGLKADDQRGAEIDSAERLLERLSSDAALVIHGDDLRLAQAQVAEREINRFVSLYAGEDADARRSAESVALQIPPNAIQYFRACSGETREVGHRGTGDETDVGGRQTEQIQ